MHDMTDSTEQPTQLPLDLSLDMPLDSIPEHSIRSIGKQKIKNITVVAPSSISLHIGGGFLSQKEKQYSPRAQQIMRRYGSNVENLWRGRSRYLSQEEKIRDGGAWDWKIWEEKFYQLLSFRRFIPHPLLYILAEQKIEFPITWTFIPAASSSSYFGILDLWQRERVFSGAQIYLGRLGNAKALQTLEKIYQALDIVHTKQAKPYPNIRAILPAHDSDLSEFLLSRKAGKKQCYRAHFVEFTDGYLGKELVYEPVLREIWQAYRGGFCVEGIYGNSFLQSIESGRLAEASEQNFIGKDRVCIGAINLAEFVDSERKEILWEELENAFQTTLRFVDNWMHASSVKVNSPWIGLVGWGSSLELLGVQDDSLAFSKNFAQRFFAMSEEKQAKRLKKIAILPSHSKFFTQVAGVGADFSLPLVANGVITKEGILQDMLMQEIFCKQSLPSGLGKSLLAVRGVEKLEFSDFVFVVGEALRAGWMGVRFI